MGFRENLKSELEYQGLTTKELSKKSGVNKRTLDHYLMNNPQEPSVTNAFYIARALNVTVEYLLTGKNTATDNTELIEIMKQVNKLSDKKLTAIKMVLDIFSTP